MLVLWLSLAAVEFVGVAAVLGSLRISLCPSQKKTLIGAKECNIPLPQRSVNLPTFIFSLFLAPGGVIASLCQKTRKPAAVAPVIFFLRPI